MSIVHDAARMIGMNLAPGTTAQNAICPVCEGGRSKERSFSVTRQRDGRLSFNCFRASCTVNGGHLDDYGNAAALPTQKLGKEYKLRPYTGEKYPLCFEDLQFFEERFNIYEHVADKHISLTEHGDYLFDVIGQDYALNGYVIRRPVWSGEPQPPREGKGYGVKALTMMHAEAEPIAFYRGFDYNWGGSRLRHQMDHSTPLVIVEDQVSAMRLLSSGYKAVALLGTTLNLSRVREIQRESKRVILALDEDATAKAFKLAQQWGPAFDYFRVAILDMDIKDMTPWTEREVLGL